MNAFEYDWEVLEIIKPSDGEQRRGAMVKYTPLTKGCSECEVFVPIPWHKATDATNAREMMERKINARAPTHIWNKELNPDPPDQTDEVTADLTESLPKGKKRGDPEPERRDDDPEVSESSGPEGDGE